ncbi:MAG: NTP transferase domain-containing protein [Acetobacterium woodii]|nr:NTP transferase domain-containing protein [Acetobacterium woodii]
MKKNKFAAIIIAAGFSSRMDGFKPLLKFGNETAVEKVVNTYQQAGVNEIILVLGHRAEEITPYFKHLPIKWVINENFKQGMYTSIIKGVSQLSEAVDAFFIHPVDIPLVKPQSIEGLMNFFEKTEKGIMYPCFSNKRGHPPLIHSRYQNLIIANQEDGGLKNLLEKYEVDALNLPLADQSILMDMDTRLDYEALLDYARQNTPNPNECEALLDIFQTPAKVRKHSQKVKEVALKIATQLTDMGVEIDTDSLAAAALLHDIVKTEKYHPEKGALILKKMGYEKIGNMILTHMDIEVENNDPISEREILYLADKLVQEDQFVKLSIRKAEIQEKFRYQPEALEKINKRYQDAEMIIEKIETVTGKDFWDEQNDISG